MLVILLIWEFLLLLIYLGSIWLRGESLPWLDFNGYQNLPSLFSAGQLFVTSLGFLALGFYSRQGKAQPSRRLLLTLGVLFFYISIIDETFKVHQHFYKPLCYLPVIDNCRSWYNLYIYLYILMAVAIFIGFFRDLKAAWKFYPLGALFSGMGMFIFLLGALGLELLKFKLLEPLLLSYIQVDSGTFILIEKMRIGLEEFLEMVGTTMTLYSLGLFWSKRLERLLSLVIDDVHNQ